MNTQTENLNTKIHQLKREVKYWQTKAMHYQQQIENQTAMSDKLELCMNDISYLKQMLFEKVAKTSVQEHIEAAIGEVYPHFLPSMVSCRSRKGEIVELRQIWMQLMYKYSGLSLSKVGDLAGRDHTTVIHAIHKVDAMCLYEKRFRMQYEKVLKNLISKLHSTEN